MSTLICPTRFKGGVAVAVLALIVSGCATETPPSQQTVQPVSMPTKAPSTPLATPAAPSILIRGKSSAAILTSIVKYRTQKGMKIVQRDKQRLVFSMPVPRSSPPAEARMIFSLAPAADGLLLTAQVFQVVQGKGKKAVTRDVTASLSSKLEAELAMYAEP